MVSFGGEAGINGAVEGGELAPGSWGRVGRVVEE
jgi:hypothetical protein